MAGRRRRPHPGRLQPGHRQGNRPRRSCRHGRPGPRAGCRPKRFREMARYAGRRAQQDHAQGRGPDARARRRHRRSADPGAGQAAGGSQGRGHGRGRHHRVVRRRRAARVRPHRALARQPGDAPDGAQGSRGAGGGVHALEFPDQPGGAQDGGGAGHRLLDDREGGRRDAGVARRTDPHLCRRGPAARCAGTGVRQSGRHLQLPDPASRHPQDHLHRLDAGGQAAGRPWPAST